MNGLHQGVMCCKIVLGCLHLLCKQAGGLLDHPDSGLVASFSIGQEVLVQRGLFVCLSVQVQLIVLYCILFDYEFSCA